MHELAEVCMSDVYDSANETKYNPDSIMGYSSNVNTTMSKNDILNLMASSPYIIVNSDEQAESLMSKADDFIKRYPGMIEEIEKDAEYNINSIFTNIK